VIIAIEGPSAVGKTTWCRAHLPTGSADEVRDNIEAPDLYADPAEVSRFWVNFNIERWQAALRIEEHRGLAICDGDPFHLYFSWSLWKAGLIPSRLFEMELPLYRRAIQDRRLGLADLVCWREAPLDELRRRAKSDPTRRRRRHETYLSLIPWMKVWFEMRERALPGTVRDWPDDLTAEQLSVSPAPAVRYDVRAVDQWMESLSCAWNHADLAQAAGLGNRKAV